MDSGSIFNSADTDLLFAFTACQVDRYAYLGVVSDTGLTLTMVGEHNGSIDYTFVSGNASGDVLYGAYSSDKKENELTLFYGGTASCSYRDKLTVNNFSEGTLTPLGIYLSG